MAKYNAIYGSFAALPLFLVWLQISWLVVLLGAEISFVHQNVDTYEFEPDCLRVSYSFKKLLALRVMTVLVKNFISSKPATTAHDLVLQLEIPVRLLRQILHELMKAGMVAETLRDDKSKAFAPAVDVNKISLGYVVKRLEDHGVDDIPVLQDPDLGYLSKSLEKFSEDIDKDDMNILLKDI